MCYSIWMELTHHPTSQITQRLWDALYYVCMYLRVCSRVFYVLTFSFSLLVSSANPVGLQMCIFCLTPWLISVCQNNSPNHSKRAEVLLLVFQFPIPGVRWCWLCSSVQWHCVSSCVRRGQGSRDISGYGCGGELWHCYSLHSEVYKCSYPHLLPSIC